MRPVTVHIGHIGGRDVELIQVVRTRLAHRGRGTEADPNRYLTQYWSTEGELLAEVDPVEQPTAGLGIVRQGTGW